MHEIHTQTCPEVPVEAVKHIAGFERIRGDYPGYLTDESKYPGGRMDALFFPEDEAELAAVLRKMAASGTPVTVAGARTGLVGGCVPMGGVLVSLERLNAVTDLYYDGCAAEWRVRAQCAVSLEELGRCLLARRFPWIERHASEDARERLARFQKDPHAYFYPPDPTELSASIGGTVATNASGARTYRYGPTRDWVRRIRVMLANGEVLDIPRGKHFASPGREFVICDSDGTVRRVKTPSYRLPETKNAAGIFSSPHMDLIDLFIGSEGIFGIITAVDVALAEQKEKIAVIQFVDSDEQALDLVEALRGRSEIVLDCLEFFSEASLNLLRRRRRQEPGALDMPPIPAAVQAAVFMELAFDSEPDEAAYALINDAVGRCGADPEKSWVAYEPRDLERFKAFRHLLPETVNAVIAERKQRHPGLHKLGTDFAVPRAHLQELWRLYKRRLDAAGMQWLAFGHIGDNHIHVNILPRDMEELGRGIDLYRRFAAEAIRLGGTVSAEHGIGKIKAPYLKTMYSAAQIQEMRGIKRVLDPAGILNPGDLFAADPGD